MEDNGKQISRGFDLNKVMLIGRLTADVKINEAETSGIFTIALNGGYVDRETGEVKSTVEFVRCVSFRKSLYPYLKKGKLIHVEGHLHTYKNDNIKIKFEDKEYPYKITEVIATRVVLLSSGNEIKAGANSEVQIDTQVVTAEVVENTEKPKSPPSTSKNTRKK